MSRPSKSPIVCNLSFRKSSTLLSCNKLLLFESAMLPLTEAMADVESLDSMTSNRIFEVLVVAIDFATKVGTVEMIEKVAA